ncbi:hypothetical protein EV2_014847 [Malus domestica]
MAGGAVSWRSKKKTTRLVSTMELEYIGCFEAMRHGVWLKILICDMKIVKNVEEPIKIYCDNTSAMFFAKNNRRSEASRLMDIKYLKLQDEIRNRNVGLENISTFSMVTNPLTKTLHVTTFQKHLLNMGLQTTIDNV